MSSFVPDLSSLTSLLSGQSSGLSHHPPVAGPLLTAAYKQTLDSVNTLTSVVLGSAEDHQRAVQSIVLRESSITRLDTTLTVIAVHVNDLDQTLAAVIGQLRKLESVMNNATFPQLRKEQQQPQSSSPLAYSLSTPSELTYSHSTVVPEFTALPHSTVLTPSRSTPSIRLSRPPLPPTSKSKHQSKARDRR